MERTFEKKMKTLNIFLFAAFIIGIIDSIMMLNLAFMLLTLFYGIFMWKSTKRETFILRLFMIYAFLYLVSSMFLRTDFLDNFGLSEVSAFYTKVSFLLSAILFVYLFFVSMNKNRKIRNKKMVKTLLIILMWVYIATQIVIIIVFVTAIIQNRSTPLEHWDMRVFAIYALVAVAWMVMMFPALFVLYIMQKSFDPVFYKAFIKENPANALSEKKDEEN